MEQEKKIKEYELLQNLEIETTKVRHTTFTALLSISFLIPSFSIKIDNASTVDLLQMSIPIGKMIFLFGFIFYIFTIFHYNWYHRYSHKYRRRLKELESELGFSIYKNRVRPMLWKRFKMHFDWALYIIGAVYAIITAVYVDLILFMLVCASMVLTYFILILTTYKQPAEPLE